MVHAAYESEEHLYSFRQLTRAGRRLEMSVLADMLIGARVVICTYHRTVYLACVAAPAGVGDAREEKSNFLVL